MDVIRVSATEAAREDPAQDDLALCRQAREGDHEAFAELVRRNQRLVWSVCRQYVGGDDADEAAQETFLKAYSRLASYDGRARFSTWLVRIGINACLDSLRKRGRRGVRVEEDPGHPIAATLPDRRPDPERRASARQAVARLAELEARLPDRQREIFRLRFYAELGLDEIAAALDVHVGTVKTQLHRAVHRLRREMEDETCGRNT